VPLSYLASPYVGRRRLTREVRVGDVGIGGANPIRVQSMTNTDTRDCAATVAQIEALANAGCEIVRLTVPSIRDAEALEGIRKELELRRVGVPLVADIHFTPNAAMISADWVEKVRVNPGNYVDKKKFEVREFSDAEYGVEVEKVADRFRPLVRKCRERGVAMRIGTNHGSLSDRIMNRFGDTPLGMVESALEFLDVCEAESFFDVVFSMKASNTQVAIQAYRQLAARLEERAPDASVERRYPFHVGVTEAGDAEDGRIKSAIGIGALLEDGLGDTVRVSLTEDPVREVPVARKLARRAETRWEQDLRTPDVTLPADYTPDPFAFQRRTTRPIDLAGLELGGDSVVRVELDFGELPHQELEAWAARIAASLAGVRDIECEGIAVTLATADALKDVAGLRSRLVAAGLEMPLALKIPCSSDLPADALSAEWGIARLVIEASGRESDEELESLAAFAARCGVPLEWCLQGGPGDLPEGVSRTLAASRSAGLSSLLYSSDSPRAVHSARSLAVSLREAGFPEIPIILRVDLSRANDAESSLIDAGIDLGAPLCDGIGDMVSVSVSGDPAHALDLGYRVLQGARMRVTRTEFISCPSCGRTLFDLEEVTARIKRRTEHLKGLKIAIMGCIVNGPGEMADADFGYVGSGPGRVTLYVGKEIRVRNVEEDEAPDRLVELIQDSGRWLDPPPES